ncbi:unnamed protein product [Kuraishia capsulata CBS 1993]|uniref:RING-type domain-containing protein n=1 Tax=Kuraishia capsulata CBS 1993 TaxID=1382522 RepID=W6MFM1_9ASCO|nr:uncharacterized protein KUCA_T00000118001 [Kuraishia capsulata CBS 1993]CDK24158.1 unnamed protein product [Kuraishia capsulata CBS 1993]
MSAPKEKDFKVPATGITRPANVVPALRLPGTNTRPSMSKNGPRAREGSSFGKRKNGRQKALNRPDIPDLDFDMRLEEQLVSNKYNGRNRRAVDISHLLEFSSPAHAEEGFNRGLSRRKPRSNNRGATSLHLTGMKYINVNYKFVVDYRGDYRQQLLDPNVPLDKTYILRVIAPKNDTQCPICLEDDLVAPRMAKCGHIFCLTCFIRLMEAEETRKGHQNNDPRRQKKKECPLCGIDITTVDALPVLINGIDERLEKPVVGEDVLLQLVYRPASRILPLPAQYKDEYMGNIPWVNEDSTPETFTNDNPCSQYARIMKAGLPFVKNSFLKEITDIQTQYENDKALYNIDDSAAKSAIDHINMTLDVMNESFHRTEQERVPTPLHMTDLNLNLQQSKASDPSTKLSELVDGVSNISLSATAIPDFDGGFYFYQSDSNSKVKFFLSSLDLRIIVSLLGEDRALWPAVIKARLENINYDFGVVDSELVHRFKYLGHLPFGTEVAFLELDWFEEPDSAPKLNATTERARRSSKNRRSILPPDVFKEFSKALLERSNRTHARRQREDKDKRKFEKRLELETLEFYSNENNIPLTDYGYERPHKQVNEFDRTLSAIEDDGSDHEHSSTNARAHTSQRETTKTIWGTDIIKPVDDPIEDDDEDDWNTELLIQQAKASTTGKKSRKKLTVLFSSSMR